MKTRVLVVESDDVSARNYRRYFSATGFDVRTVVDVEQYRKALSEFEPQVVVLEPDVFVAERPPASRPETAVLVVSKQDREIARLPTDCNMVRRYVKPASLRQITMAIRQATEKAGT